MGAGMTKYEVTGIVPNLGKVKHVFRAESKAAAKERYRRVQPKAAKQLEVKEVRA